MTQPRGMLSGVRVAARTSPRYCGRSCLLDAVWVAAEYTHDGAQNEIVLWRVSELRVRENVASGVVAVGEDPIGLLGKVGPLRLRLRALTDDAGC